MPVEVLKNLTLITGGARSGKSDFAERLAKAQSGNVIYVATMGIMPDDAEVGERIARHQVRRPVEWLTIEEPVLLPECISKLAPDSKVCLVDCLSLWVSNILLAHPQDASHHATCEKLVAERVAALLSAIRAKPTTTFFIVTNEVGSGIVPENKLARTFRDILGAANQVVAGSACQVWLSCVGLQLRLKPAENLDPEQLSAVDRRSV